MNIELTKIEWPNLNTFLKKVETDKLSQLVDRQDQKIVGFNREQGKASLAQPSSFGNLMKFFTKSMEYYLVDTYKGLNTKSNQFYKINSSRFGPMELTIGITISAYPGLEIRLVESLVRRNDPVKILSDSLQEWVGTIIRNCGDDLFLDFAKFQKDLAETLKQKGENLGLRLSTYSTKIGSGEPKEIRIPISVEGIIIQPKGYSDFLSIGFDIGLVFDPTAKIHATGSEKEKDDVKNLLVAWLQEYIQQSVSFNLLAESLHTSLREDIKQFWNTRLTTNRKPWKIRELKFNLSRILPDRFDSKQIPIDVVLREGSIELTNTVTLTLDNPERFKNARIENLEEWLKDKLRQIAQSTLTGIAFAELAAKLDEFQRIIKSDLDKEARQIGYKVQYLLTSGPIHELNHAFAIEFSSEEQDFDTDSNDRIKLNVIVNGRITSFDHYNWKQILRPGEDYKTAIKKEVLREVRKYLLRCTPEEYYLQFDTKIRPEIETRVCNLLINQFNVDDNVDIILRWQGSALIERLRHLMKGFNHVDVEYQKNRKEPIGQSKMKFKITYNVEGVHPAEWARFADRSFDDAKTEIEALSDLLRRTVENIMRREFAGNPMSTNTQLADYVKAFAMHSIPVIVSETGLRIRINSVEELHNEYADEIEELTSDYFRERLKMQILELKYLDEQIAKLKKSNHLPERLKELEKEKAKLEQELSGSAFKKNQLRADSKDGFSQKWLQNDDEN